MGATDLQFGAGIFIPEAKSPVRPDSCQCTVDGVKRDGIYLGGRRGEEEDRKERRVTSTYTLYSECDW